MKNQSRQNAWKCMLMQQMANIQLQMEALNNTMVAISPKCKSVLIKKARSNNATSVCEATDSSHLQTSLWKKPLDEVDSSTNQDAIHNGYAFQDAQSTVNNLIDKFELKAEDKERYNPETNIEKDVPESPFDEVMLQYADQSISYKMQLNEDPSYTVRKTFLRKVYQLLKENKISLRYVCTFTLASTDLVGDVRVNSIKYLAEVIDSCRRDSFNQNSSSQDDRRQIVNTPEYIVIFLIHILARDQGFPLERLGDNESYPEFCSPLVILLRALVDLEDFNGNRSDMLLNLLAILCAIKKADDANDAHITPKLHVLSDIAMLILKLLGKGLKPTSKIHRMILLPSSFYKVFQDSKVYDLDESFFDENFAKRILDVVDSSIMKPDKSSPKQCAKPPQVGASYMGSMKDNSEDLFEAEEIKLLAPKSKLTKDIEHNHGNALDKNLLQKRTLSAQHSKTCSIFNYWPNENSDVQDRPNFICENYDANLGDELLSSCNSASTECYFSGMQTLTVEGEVEVLNPLLTKRIAKCNSISFLGDQDPVPDNCLMSKESTHKGNGLFRHRICSCPAVGICSCSGSIDSCDSQQNSYMVEEIVDVQIKRTRNGEYKRFLIK